MSRITRSAFRPAPWLRNCHAQTIWSSLVSRRGPTQLRHERWELDDGDFLDLAWVDAEPHQPLVMVLHGLEGAVSSGYAQGLLAACEAHRWGACLMHFRGCSGQPNRLARGYHSGETGDLDCLVRRIRQRHPLRPLAVVGFSLGGNVVLKWLGEQGGAADVQAAVAVSVPLRLEICAERMESGFSRLYARHLTRRLRHNYRRKFAQRDDAPYPLGQLDQLHSFTRFDHAITAPLHGYASATDYYQRCSSRQFLSTIQVPTLIIQAIDDPFMTPEVLPSSDELSASTVLELSGHGGHVGFIGGQRPWQPDYWLDRRIPDFLGKMV